MPPRQMWIFKFGCWTTIVTAIVLLVWHLTGVPEPANDTERELMSLATSYRFRLLGGAERSLLDALHGYTLIVTISLTMMGSLGLMVQKRATDDLDLMLAVARALAVGSLALLVMSLTRLFILPSLFFALMTVSFAVSSVRK